MTIALAVVTLLSGAPAALAQAQGDPFQGVRPAPLREPPAPRPRPEPPATQSGASFRGTYVGSAPADGACPAGTASITIADGGQLSGSFSALMRIGPMVGSQRSIVPVTFAAAGAARADGTLALTWTPSGAGTTSTRSAGAGTVAGDEMRIDGPAADASAPCNRRWVLRRRP
jgi:hypothetical protein